MLPLPQLIQIVPQQGQPLYLQIVSQVIQAIQKGNLAPGQGLPGSRQWARLLQVNRNTVVAALEELQAQGWLEIRPNQGTFVAAEIPLAKGHAWKEEGSAAPFPDLPYAQFSHIELSPAFSGNFLELDDGLPDVRLAPLASLGRAYKRILTQPLGRKLLYYGDPQGNPALRQELIHYLQQSRGMKIELEQLMLTRGCIMSLFLLAQTLLQPGDGVLVGESSYRTANMIFQQANATLYRVPVDKEGLVVEAMETLLQTHRIRAVYVASQHHHPTTVTLSAARRVQLLRLARQYGFRILEDDYDYEFHYPRNPILPMASTTQGDPMVYLGSLSKTLAPAFRIGYLVADAQLVKSLVRLRRITDRQGDQLLEQTVAQLFWEGEIQRHLRKSLGVYRERRDVFCQLLRAELGDAVQFDIPEGGLAVWATFDASIDLTATVSRAREKGLLLHPGTYYQPEQNPSQATRLGFARSNVEELSQAVQLLKQSLCLRSR